MGSDLALRTGTRLATRHLTPLNTVRTLRRVTAQITQNRDLGIPAVKASSQSRINTVIVYQCHCGIGTTACRHLHYRAYVWSSEA
jgi:hypothetical protein